jgi:hypothetical protein
MGLISDAVLQEIKAFVDILVGRISASWSCDCRYVLDVIRRAIAESAKYFNKFNIIWSSSANATSGGGGVGSSNNNINNSGASRGLARRGVSSPSGRNVSPGRKRLDTDTLFATAGDSSSNSRGGAADKVSTDQEKIACLLAALLEQVRCRVDVVAFMTTLCQDIDVTDRVRADSSVSELGAAIVEPLSRRFEHAIVSEAIPPIIRELLYMLSGTPCGVRPEDFLSALFAERLERHLSAKLGPLTAGFRSLARKIQYNGADLDASHGQQYRSRPSLLMDSRASGSMSVTINDALTLISRVRDLLDLCFDRTPVGQTSLCLADTAALSRSKHILGRYDDMLMIFCGVTYILLIAFWCLQCAYLLCIWLLC